ncbi:serine hydrolase [Streptomyces spororaveus]|uniref:serine hydrolase n=1 Tax=Streptomyces spororaveus TaxID=284039 RepID=UPI0036A11720
MKAVTVAGGSSDEPEIEAETTVVEGTPEVAAKADAEGRVEPEATDTDSDSDDATCSTADARAGSGPSDAVTAQPKAEPEPTPEADPEPEGDTAPRPARDAEAEPARRRLEDEPQPEAGAKAGGELPSEARSAAEAAPAAAAPENGPRTTAVPEADPRAGTKTEPEAAADTAPEGEAEPKAAADAEPEAEVEARTEPKAKAAANAAPEAEAEPKAAADAEPEGEAEPEAATDPEGEAEPRTEPEAARAEADDTPEAEAAAQAAPEDGAEPKAAADPEPPVKDPADAKADPEPKAEAEAAAKAAPKGKTDPEPPAKGPADAKADPEPEAEAGGESEGRSGAGERSARDQADGGAEPEAPGGSGAAADETMLIALPKQKTAGPSWAREPEPEPDPERTSQFVALKDIDLPAPVAPRAQPRPAAEATAAVAAPAVPLPPLDLLAELTNTPAPPETPRRTALRRVKIWTPILLLLAGAGVGAQLLRPLPAPQLVAAETDRTLDGQFSVPWPAKGQGAVRVSGSGDIGTFGEQKPVPTASVAKVMTAYVILKGHPLRKADPGPDITIDAKTVADGKADHESRVEGLTVGQKFSQQDVLKMLMIPSGNNAARLLARWDTGTDSEAAFVAKMNAAAKELGMTNTTYTDPSGLDSGTVSTAVDQLKLAEAVMKDEVFRSIVALPNASIKGLSTRLENNNILLTSQGLSIRGIKTGSSTPAGGALMWAAYKSIDGKDQLVLGTLMDQHADGPDEDGADSLKLVLANSKTIIEGVRTALASAPVIRKGDVVGHVDDGLGGRTPLVATKDLNVIGVPGQQLKLSVTTGAGAGAGALPHTAKAGTEVAVLTVGSGEGAKSVPVAVKGALAEPSFGTRLTRGR